MFHAILEQRRRFLSGIISIILLIAPFGIGKNAKLDPKPGETKVIEVKAGGAYETVEAARDYVRTLDKTKYGGIDIVIADSYAVTEPIVLTEADSGTETCQIRYLGKDGTYLSGGITFDSSAFTAEFGEIAQYFKADAKANIVALDLKQFGYTEADVARVYTNPETGKMEACIDNYIPRLYVDGALAKVARYPSEGYITFVSGKVLCEGGAAKAIDRVTETEVILHDEDAAVVASWHDLTKVFVKGRYGYFWVPDNDRITKFEGNVLTTRFAGGYDPRDGLFLYLENIPEELDAPNEYYIDDNAVLYLVKNDNFDNAHFTIPKAKTLLKVEGADYVTVENLILESADGHIIDAEGDYFTLKNCEVRDSVDRINLRGSHVTVDSCVFHDFCNAILSVFGGSQETLTYAENLITNSEFYDWALVGKFYNAAVVVDGVGMTVSHNKIHDSSHMAIGWEGNFHTFEYNEVYNVCNDTDDAGAIYAYNSYAHYGNVFRYNYIHDIGCQNDILMNIKDYPYCYCGGIYFDGGKSGQTVYKNVFERISGAGVIASGRDEVVDNNLFISCGYAMDVSAWYYEGYLYGRGGAGGMANQGFSNFLNNEVWKKTFPQFFDFIWTESEEELDNPNLYIAPAGCHVMGNYIYFDMAANLPSLRSYGHLYSFRINEAVRKFCGDDIEDFTEGVNQTTFTSKRRPITVEEAVEATKDITGITPELFAEIGLLK